MQAPHFVRPPTESERRAATVGLRLADAFTMRRCQIVFASARGERAPQIARALGCGEQTVRNALHAFARTRTVAHAIGGSRIRTLHAVRDAVGTERRRALLHRPPRGFGHGSSPWRLAQLAATAYANRDG